MFLSVFESPRKTYRLITIKYIETHFSTAMQEILWLTMIRQLKKYWISVMVKLILLSCHCIWLHHLLSKNVSLSAGGMTSSPKKDYAIVIDRIGQVTPLPPKRVAMSKFKEHLNIIKTA